MNDALGTTDSEPFYVVGLGASAGGLEALEQFFDNAPSDERMAYVVVQHLSPDFKSLMNELLARHTSMPIFRVENGMRVEPNGIYLIPPKKNMILADGKLLLTEQDSSGGLNLPIDIFFRSLAHDAGKNSVAVVFSGTGSDGSRGIEDVYEAGGMVLVQSVESAGFDGMPRNAIATGVAHSILKPQEMPATIVNFVSDPDSFASGKTIVDEPIMPGEELTAIFSLFRNRFGIDFTLYREGTIQRRIERRMQLIHCEKLKQYAERIREDTSELEQLYRDLLVEVTQFFRDAQAFERLKKEVIPQLVKKAVENREEIRVWVAGCATGEEAYSLAMLIDDCARKLEAMPIVKVFATDLHRNSLEAASVGVYSTSAMANVPEDFRKRYFSLHGSLWHVNANLRKSVIFAPHNLCSDPPFTRIDLVSCRNVLIYFEPEVQQRVLSLFHFGLNLGGYMLLGSSESVGELSREFETVDQHWRVFRKLRDVRLRDANSIPMSPALVGIVKSNPPLAGLTGQSNSYLTESVLDSLLEKYVPPSFLVDQHMELVHSFGDARKLLSQPKGRPTLELLKMVEGELRMALSTALHRSIRERQKVVLQGVQVETDSRLTSYQVIVEPYNKRGQDLYLVCLEEMQQRVAIEPTAEQFQANDEAAQRIIDLEKELEYKKESLQTTVEELESSNEELQSTNEELVASNEELQSTNEELHSVNEELYTVNAEHQRKIDELTSLTADMDNLIKSTEIGTIFLDRELRIRRFTPSVTSAFNILDQDIGRPIDQFAYHFENSNWTSNALHVIETGEPQESQLQVRNSNKTYLKRMRPYRSTDGKIDGVVITFTDVSLVVRAKAIEERQAHLERITRDLQDFAYAVSHDFQAPVRQIRQAVEILTDESDQLSDVETDKFMGQLKSRVNAIDEMMRCLLDYSRVNTKGGEFFSVDFNSLFSEVMNDLGDEIEEAKAEISRDELPVITGDAKQLHRVFMHLIDNALKYCDGKKPKIHVGVTRDENNWIFAFADNGIGIAPQHLKDIFKIFKRLGFMKSVKGNGYGLAVCRRILERHRGVIWAESIPSEGSTVFVKFPCDDEL